MKAGYGKAGKQKTLSNFPTATTTTNYNYLWDTDSEGKVRGWQRKLYTAASKRLAFFQFIVTDSEQAQEPRRNRSRFRLLNPLQMAIVSARVNPLWLV